MKPEAKIFLEPFEDKVTGKTEIVASLHLLYEKDGRLMEAKLEPATRGEHLFVKDLETGEGMQVPVKDFLTFNPELVFEMKDMVDQLDAFYNKMTDDERIKLIESHGMTFTDFQHEEGLFVKSVEIPENNKTFDPIGPSF